MAPPPSARSKGETGSCCKRILFFAAERDAALLTFILRMSVVSCSAVACPALAVRELAGFGCPLNSLSSTSLKFLQCFCHLWPRVSYVVARFCHKRGGRKKRKKENKTKKKENTTHAHMVLIYKCISLHTGYIVYGGRTWDFASKPERGSPRAKLGALQVNFGWLAQLADASKTSICLEMYSER